MVFSIANVTVENILLTLRAVFAYPARKALTRSIDRVASPVVGTLTDFSTVLPIFSTGTHCGNTRQLTQPVHYEH